MASSIATAPSASTAPTDKFCSCPLPSPVDRRLLSNAVVLEAMPFAKADRVEVQKEADLSARFCEICQEICEENAT
jgi:hypothetical protein